MRCSAQRAPFARNRCSQSLPPSSPPWRAKRRVAASNALACRQLPHCRNGSAQKSPVCCRVQQTSLSGNSCSFDCCRLPVGTHRLSRAPGPPGDQTDDRLGSVWKRGLTPRRKGPPCAADSLPLDTRLLMLLGSRHTTRPAHAGVGGHRTTVSPHVLYCVPTNPGPLSFCAWPVRRCHWPVPSTHT